MITIGMNYKVRDGKATAFETAFDKVLQAMGRCQGHVKTDLYSHRKNANCFLILSEWSDRASFDAFVNSDAFRSVTNWGREEILAERPAHHYYGADDSHAPPAGPTTGKCPMSGS